MKPLTIEELKALEVGDWVWVIDIERDERFYVRKDEECEIRVVGDNIDDEFAYSTADEFGAFSYSEYNKTWLAFKNKEQAECKNEIVELPCSIGDTIYFVEYFCNYKGCGQNEQAFCCGCKEMLERERNKDKYVIREKKFAWTDLPLMETKYFVTREEAERRLAELKGEKA